MGGSKKLGGLCAFEWAMIVYAVLTLVLMLFTYTRLQNPVSMLWLRVQAVAITLGLWAVYRMVPCRLTMLCRVLGQIALLGSWYPDTYEFNRMMPNLDHVFATWEQQLFGFQPALLFSQAWSSPWVSELLTMGYVSYYPLMVVVPLFYFFFRKEQFLKVSFVMLASFFLFYVIFIFLPVAGPQYYYLAVGTDQIAQGIFPNLGNYFETHSEALRSPGWSDGIFYKLLVVAHEAGERPTAAFPSSHMGIMVVLLCQAWATRNRWFFWSLVPFGVLMFFATFYLQAHYVIDAIAGVFAGLLMYLLFTALYHLIAPKGKK